MILSGPNACRGSTKDARIYTLCVSLLRTGAVDALVLTFPAFLHSLPEEVGKGLLMPNGMLLAGILYNEMECGR